MTPTIAPLWLFDDPGPADWPVRFGDVRVTNDRGSRVVCWLRADAAAVSVILAESADAAEREQALALVRERANGRTVTIDGEQP